MRDSLAKQLIVDEELGGEEPAVETVETELQDFSERKKGLFEGRHAAFAKPSEEQAQTYGSTSSSGI